MTHAEIVSRDFNKNHMGRAYDEAHAQTVVEKYKYIDGKLFESPNVLLFYKPVNGGVEFHCMNGGSGADLTTAINDFLTLVAGEYESAATYYDNPRINDLVRYSKYPATITKIDGGEDRTYEMAFNLRSKKWEQ